MSADLVTVPSVLLDRFMALGVDVGALLLRADVLPSRFQVPRAKLTTREFFDFWHAVGEAGGTPALALRIGSEALSHQLDVVSLAALHSPNLGEALTKLARYKRLFCAEEIGIETADGEARIGFHWIHADETLPLALVDVTFASVLALGRRGAGNALTPLRVELARRRAHEPLSAPPLRLRDPIRRAARSARLRGVGARAAVRDAQRRPARDDGARTRDGAHREPDLPHRRRRREGGARTSHVRRAGPASRRWQRRCGSVRARCSDGSRSWGRATSTCSTTSGGRPRGGCS